MKREGGEQYHVDEFLTNMHPKESFGIEKDQIQTKPFVLLTAPIRVQQVSVLFAVLHMRENYHEFLLTDQSLACM